MKTNLIYEQDTYLIIGKCMEVHRVLGHGFLEVVYKDALEYEFSWADISYKREQEFKVPYKDIILRRKYFADFTVFHKIILEAKSLDDIPEKHTVRMLNYLKVSGYKVGLIVNFGKTSLQYKRVVL